MKLRLLALSLAALFAAGPAAQAADKPLVVVRIQSIDNLLKQVRYVAKKAGKADEAEGILAFAENLITEKEGLEGIDTSRTWGAAVDLSANLEQPKVLIMLPIKSEKAFEQLLRFRAGIQPKKNGDIYTVQTDQLPFDIHYTFAQGYVFVTGLTKENLKNLPEAKKLVGIKDPAVTLDVAVNIDALPRDLKQTALGAVERFAAQAKDSAQFETEAQRAAGMAALDYAVTSVKILLDQAGPARLALRLDEKMDELALVLDAAGKTGSDLAKFIGTLGKVESDGAATVPAVGDGLAVRGGLVAALPDEIREPLAKVIDNQFDSMASQANSPQERKLAKTVLDALKPTAKRAKLDLGLGMAGPNADGHYTVVGALGVVKGKGIESAVKEIVAAVPQAQGIVQVDFAKAGGVSLHKVTPPPGSMDADAARMFGDSPYGVLAFEDGRAVFAFGPDAEAQARGLLKAKAGKADLASMTVSMSRAIRLATVVEPEDDEARRMAKAAVEVFGKDGAKAKGKDRIRMKVAGGKKLTVKLAIDGNVIGLFARAAAATAGF